VSLSEVLGLFSWVHVLHFSGGVNLSYSSCVLGIKRERFPGFVSVVVIVFVFDCVVLRVFFPFS